MARAGAAGRLHLYGRLWRTLSDRLERSESTRAMIELLKQGRRDGYGRPTRAIEDALASGCTDPAAVK